MIIGVGKMAGVRHFFGATSLLLVIREAGIDLSRYHDCDLFFGPLFKNIGHFLLGWWW